MRERPNLKRKGRQGFRSNSLGAFELGRDNMVAALQRQIWTKGKNLVSPFSSSVPLPTLVEVTLIIAGQCALKVRAGCGSVILFCCSFHSKDYTGTKFKMHVEHRNETEQLALGSAVGWGPSTSRKSVLQSSDGFVRILCLGFCAKSWLIILCSSLLFSITPCEFVSLRNPWGEMAVIQARCR